MKKLFTAVTFTVLAATANASDEFCSMIETLAAKAMYERQKGTAFSKTVNMPEFNVVRSLRQLVTDAYKEPVYNTRDFQNKVIRRYRDSWAVTCEEEIRR
jgi:hypothetical protein